MNAVAYRARVESQRRRLLPALNHRLELARSRLAATERASENAASCPHGWLSIRTKGGGRDGDVAQVGMR